MASHDGSWLKQLTPEQRARVHDVLGPRRGRKRSNTSGGGQLWIRHSPTTGVPRDVVLFLKSHHGGVMREWRIWPPEDGE